MKFRDDIDIEKTWLISDTHFGHRNIVGFCHRPDDFEQIITENLARDVPDTPETTLLHLGDLSYRNNAQFKAIISKHLVPKEGRKLLIQGNHDRQRYNFYRQSGFSIVRPFAIRYRTWTVSFSHYPWNDSEDGGPIPAKHLRVHGHIHNNGYVRSEYVPFLKNHINVSIEQTKYRPVHLGLLLQSVIDGTLPEDTDDPAGFISADAVEKGTPHVR